MLGVMLALPVSADLWLFALAVKCAGNQVDKLGWLVDFLLELASLRWRDGIQAHFMPWKGAESMIDQKFYQRNRCCPFHVHGMVGGRV